MGRLSLHLPNLAQEKQAKASSVLNARPRSLLSPRVKTARTKTACLIWLASSRSRPTSNRLRRLRRSQLSTWLSSARLNRSSRRPKRGQSLPWFCKQRIKRKLPCVPIPASQSTFLGVEIRRKSSYKYLLFTHDPHPDHRDRKQEEMQSY